MKKKHYALLITLSLFCAAFMCVTNTVPVGAVTQPGFESREYFLKKYVTADTKKYAKICEAYMLEIKDGAWTTEQISKVVNEGYLLEYKDELISLGYYVPTTIQAKPQSNGTESVVGSSYSAVFNAEYYMNKYPDLKEKIGNNAAALLNHFITVGMAEGRQASEEFDLAIYKKENPDLVAEYGDNNSAYYYHYITNGKAEKRIAK